MIEGISRDTLDNVSRTNGLNLVAGLLKTYPRASSLSFLEGLEAAELELHSMKHASKAKKRVVELQNQIRRLVGAQGLIRELVATKGATVQ
jgi:hypothetical protein